jgi:hypothetical protein
MAGAGLPVSMATGPGTAEQLTRLIIPVFFLLL